MSEKIAVVFSDSHLSRKTWKHKQILGDSYFAFQQIIDYAIEEDLNLIGAGDLIDKRINESSPIVFLQKQLVRLQENDLLLYYTQGQHEFDETPWLQLGDAVIHLHEAYYDIGGLKVVGLDYQGAEVLQQRLDEIAEDTDVLVAHQVWQDFMGDITLPQGSFADVPHVSTLITGDYHQCVLDKYHGKDGQDMLVFSPGATCMQKIDEPDSHYFGVLMSDGRIVRKPLRSRKFDEFVLQNEDDTAELVEHLEFYLEGAADYAADLELPPELHTPLWRITYSYRVSDIVRRLGKLVDGRAHLFWKEIPRKREVVEEMPALERVGHEAGKAITLEMCLDAELDPDEEPEAHALAARLLHAAEPEIEANRWLKEHLNE